MIQLHISCHERDFSYIQQTLSAGLVIKMTGSQFTTCSVPTWDLAIKGLSTDFVLPFPLPPGHVALTFLLTSLQMGKQGSCPNQLPLIGGPLMLLAKGIRDTIGSFSVYKDRSPGTGWQGAAVCLPRSPCPWSSSMEMNRGNQLRGPWFLQW